MHILSIAFEWIKLHPSTAYGAVFLLALSESIPVLGAVVPGTAAILAIAALVPSGTVGLWPLLCAAFIGAVLSDGLSYYLGQRYHHEITGRWPLSRHPAILARSEAFFLRHGGKGVFLARFMPGIRAFVPMIAGMSRMPRSGFYAANVSSAAAWALTHVMPGVAIGGYFHAGAGTVGWLALPALAVIAIGALLITVSRHVLRRRPAWFRPVDGRDA